MSPISPLGTTVASRNSTTPAKFRVCDSNGNSIGTPGVVTDFRVVQVLTGTASTDVDTAVNSTTPDSAFRWDPTAQQWIFNIKNSSFLPGNTYVFRIGLNDGTSITFRYGIK